MHLKLSDNEWENKMLNYKNDSDQKLLQKIQDGDEDAMDALLERYRGYVRMEARKFFLAGGDEEDLIQEGMIGLFKAVRSYEEGKDTSFATFAMLCVRRQIYTTVTASNRKKHSPLNNYISIFDEYGEEEEHNLDQVLEDFVENPEEVLIQKEAIKGYYQEMEKKLSSFEKQVMRYYLRGESYTEIARKLGKPDKSIDNAIQRIRRKLDQNS